MTYAQAIRELRIKIILIQFEIVELLGIFIRSSNRWEREKHEATIKIKRKLALFFEKHGIEVD